MEIFSKYPLMKKNLNEFIISVCPNASNNRFVEEQNKLNEQKAPEYRDEFSLSKEMVINKVFCCVSENNKTVDNVRSIFPGGAVKIVQPPTENDNVDNTDNNMVESPDSNGGRKSPSKSYNDMIKFVFTEHGIKVISDREYVV